MADIILFRPREVYSKAISCLRPPLGLLYIATALKNKGFSVKIIDTETTDDWHSDLRNLLQEDVLLVGISVMTGYQIKGALDFSSAVKKIKPVPVVWGGLHPSLLPDQTIRHALVDIVVIGEGEETLAALAQKVQSRAPLDSVANIVFKKEGQTVRTNQNKGFLDMDTLPVPDYGLVDVEYYAWQKRDFLDTATRCLDLNTDRGCPYRCGFCYNLQFNHRSWRGASAGKVLTDIEFLVNRYNLKAVNFTSDNLFVKKDRVRSICSGLIEKKLGVAWHADMRIDTFLRYEDDLLGLMKQSGCVELTFGVESGSDRMLELINKDIHKQDVLNAHARVKEFGFRVNYHFMIGFPEETRSDIIETLQLIYLLTRDRHIKLYGPAIYIPYPGTTLFERSVEMGYKPPGHLEGWIAYDWENTSKFPWFSKGFNRYLEKVQFIAFRAATPPVNFIRWVVRKYFRLRLFGIVHGVNLIGLDVALARLCIALVRFCKQGRV
jgi:anaerobic magnesium-protoporphyrin IX monomethyl ester cyclase